MRFFAPLLIVLFVTFSGADAQQVESVDPAPASLSATPKPWGSPKNPYPVAATGPSSEMQPRDPYAAQAPRDPYQAEPRAPYQTAPEAPRDPYAATPAPATGALQNPYPIAGAGAPAPVPASRPDRNPYPKPAPSTSARISRQDLNRALSDFQALEKGVRYERTATGIRIKSVARGSFAQRLGLRSGDVVKRVAGKSVNDADAAADAYVAVTSRESFTIDVLRNGTPRALKVEVAP